MATLSAQKMNFTTGAKPTLVPATVSDQYPAGPGKFALISIGATPSIVTIVDPRVTAYGVAIPDIVLPTGTSVEKFVPLPLELADANGLVTITLSAATAVTVAAVDAYSY